MNGSDAQPSAPGIRDCDYICNVGLGGIILSKDYEYRVQTSETMLNIAAIRLMLNRLTAA